MLEINKISQYISRYRCVPFATVQRHIGVAVSAALLTRCPPCAGNALPADSRRAARAAAMRLRTRKGWRPCGRERVAAMLLRAGGGEHAESMRQPCGCDSERAAAMRLQAGGGDDAAESGRPCGQKRRQPCGCERAAVIPVLPRAGGCHAAASRRRPCGCEQPQ